MQRSGGGCALRGRPCSAHAAPHKQYDSSPRSAPTPCMLACSLSVLTWVKKLTRNDVHIHARLLSGPETASVFWPVLRAVVTVGLQ